MRWGLRVREIEIQPRGPQVLGSRLVAESEPPPRGAELGVLGALGCTAERGGCASRGRTGRGTMGTTGGREMGKEGLAEALLCTELGLSSSKSPQEDLKAPCNSSGSFGGVCATLAVHCAGMALRAGSVSVRYVSTEQL